jgi:hypothetical protein
VSQQLLQGARRPSALQVVPAGDQPLSHPQHHLREPRPPRRVLTEVDGHVHVVQWLAEGIDTEAGVDVEQRIRAPEHPEERREQMRWQPHGHHQPERARRLLAPREARKSRGYGQIRFAKDLSKAYVDVEIQGGNAGDILMFHIHCGPPGVLGPIIVDFGESESPAKKLANGKMTLELTNKNVLFVKDMPKGLKPSLPESCPADLGFLPQTQTIAGLEYLARKGVLYFNPHTKGHTYYGEMRGQVYPAKEE